MRYVPTHAEIIRKEWVFSASDVKAALLFYLRASSFKGTAPPDGDPVALIVTEGDWEHAATLRWEKESVKEAQRDG